ncbi:ribosomal protein S18 acetylase RimI-like enzyme [Paenibacillus shirakamiensis]|uniref:Ribosomal protein S18 acetylase RimI-like enzyme n=1 Tax=Paenibacillus shirakamiensis TaxID=1265935 RepID=A0ABS4JLA2_9BACL|nr:GNAT family N-acetyltransferase [Paenibacillus shirakamiensis]MBP2001856.1 ribosomal protein S18 acetylase RimI-like enzyme [Paenibacillus shirakamiensis]
MIVILDVSQPSIAQQILDIQIPAYQIEARLIGFEGIPGLTETTNMLVDSSENFLGYLIEERLVGVLSYEETEEGLHICRLIVHPDYFRQGIARQLLRYFLHQHKLKHPILVSTGSLNTPALQLYNSEGFEVTGYLEVAQGVMITNLAI